MQNGSDVRIEVRFSYLQETLNFVFQVIVNLPKAEVKKSLKSERKKYSKMISAPSLKTVRKIKSLVTHSALLT